MNKIAVDALTLFVVTIQVARALRIYLSQRQYPIPIVDLSIIVPSHFATITFNLFYDAKMDSSRGDNDMNLVLQPRSQSRTKLVLMVP
mmetsp:Transcript_31776/g.52382  ORF Transcript_31776/g.52382 Transcript_31776/m.52382 type:complete len:88 (-) Transcript_31776:176-439(-)